MALIICPNCGKSISDTTEKCFHCGYNLRTQTVAPTELQRFNKLTVSEQDKLRKEYYSKNPEYESYNKKYQSFLKKINVTAILFITFFLLFMLTWLGGIILFSITKIDQNWAIVTFIVTLLFFLVLSIAMIIVNIIMRKVTYKRYRRNNLIIDKKFQKWLKDEKGMEYVVTFTEKQNKDKEFFDQIDITKDEIER